MNIDVELDYALALPRIAGDLSELQKQLLVELYRASDAGVAAGLLAPLLGFRHHAPVNATMGRIGMALAAAVNAEAPQRKDGSRRWWAVVATYKRSPDGRFLWVLRPALRAALRDSGLVSRESEVFPEVVATERGSEEPMIEGAAIHVSVNRYERSAAARARCIEHYGSICSVCGFDFGAVYGPIAAGVIHVHHLTPLSVAGGAHYVINPIRDLRPVCPNCHVVIHRREPPLSIDEARALVSRSGGGPRAT